MAELPAQRQLVTTWGIPTQYMGQTVAMLRRVNQQVRRSGRPVELLTFDAARDVEEMTANLRSKGAWTPGLVLRNLFEDLRAWDVDGTLPDRLADAAEADPADELDVPVARTDTTDWCRRTYDADGRLVTSEMYRADGSVLARDFPVDVAGKRRRHQLLYAPDGAPWKRLGSFAAYFAWLDALLGSDEAVLVNESKAAARFVSRYPNPRVTLVHVFHESHLAEPGDPYRGKLLLQHRQTVPHLDRWDAAVFLTRRQREDVALRFGESGNLHTIPNASSAAGSVERTWRGEAKRPDRGVMVARLDPIKRIEQAVAAVAAVRAGRRGRDVTLDVFGKDEGARPVIEQAIAETGSGSYVALRGYTAEGPKQFAGASFSLMTSTTESQSLVLLESMAQGCIPISYDIRYGPAELVVDGETGFLVPDGDVDALAGTIERFLALPERRVRRLREAARQRVAAFSDEDAYASWVQLQREALLRHPDRGALSDVDVTDLAVRVVEPLLHLEAELGYGWTSTVGSLDAPGRPEVRLLLLGRQAARPRRRELAVSEVGPGRVRVAGDLDPAVALPNRKAVDVLLELRLGSSVRQVRLAGDLTVESASAMLSPSANGYLSLRRR